MAKLAEVVFGHRIRFIGLLLIPIAIGVAVAMVTPSYGATSTLRIEDPSGFEPSFVPVGWSPSQTPAQNLADSVTQAVKTPVFAQDLSDSLKTSGTISGASELKQTVASIGTKLKVNPSGSHLITLTYTCSRQVVCTSVVSNVIQIFHDQLAKIQQDHATASSTFWSSQLAIAKGNLATAQTAVHAYAAANPTVKMDSTSSDPQVQQLVSNVQLWQAKVLEAANNLSQAEYLATASARFIQVGTTVVDPPHLTGTSFIGDGSSLWLGGLVMLGGLAVVVAYAVVLAWADKTVGEPRALERRLGVPVVATIPKLVSSGGR